MKSKGFTLIELAVVLAIIAILAAIMTPLVTSYVDETRVTRSNDELRMIAQGISLHLRDTSKYPIYASMTASSTDTDVLFGPGTGVFFSGTGWGSPTSTYLHTRMNTNYFSLPTTYGTGRVAYHGPYTVTLEPDPWGNSYVVNLGAAPLGDTSSSAFASYAISAGPDGIVSTTKNQTRASFAPSGDDIVVRIR